MPDLNAPSPSSRRARKPSASDSTLQRPEMLQQTDQQRDASPDISSEEIARRAFSRWEESGRSDGHDQEHWFAAEEEIRRGRRDNRDRRPRQGEDMDAPELNDVG